MYVTTCKRHGSLHKKQAYTRADGFWVCRICADASSQRWIRRNYKKYLEKRRRYLIARYHLKRGRPELMAEYKRQQAKGG